MKRNVCVFVLLALLLAGCGVQEINIDDSAFRQGTTAMLDAILAGDYDGCRALVTVQVEDEALRNAVTQMNQLLEGVESYTIKPVGWNTISRNGITESAIRYEMETEAGKYHVEVVLVENVDGLAGFQITPVQQTQVTGTVGNMEGANVLQWLILLMGLAEFAFVVWTAVDCLRHRPKGWIGWLLLILFISSLIRLSIAGGKLSLHFDFGIYLYSTALLRDSAGGMLLRLYVPLGAIVYWLRRKKLRSKASEIQKPVPESGDVNFMEIQETIETE